MELELIQPEVTIPQDTMSTVPSMEGMSTTTDTPIIDSMLGKPEPLYSKLRNSGLDKVEAQKEAKIAFSSRVQAGEDPDAVYESVMGSGKVWWDRQKMEAHQQTVDKVNKVSASLGAIKIGMEDILSGNLSKEQKQILTTVGDWGVKEGYFKSYDLRSGKAYTPEGVPIRMNDAGILDIINASKAELSGGIAGAMMLPAMANPATTIPATGLAILGSMGGTAAGVWSDVRREEAYLKSQGVNVEPMGFMDLAQKATYAAVTDGALALTISKIGEKGTDLARNLYQSFMGRNDESAIKTLIDLTGKTREELDKGAKEYAKAAGVKVDSNIMLNKLILVNEIQNNSSLQGYLKKLVETPEVAQSLRKSVAERTAALEAVGASTTTENLTQMFAQARKATQEMMGSVRGALDDSFQGIQIPTEQFVGQATKIRKGLSPFMGTVEETSSRSALDKVMNSLDLLEQSPTIGNMFKVRTDFGSLLNKMGMFEQVPAQRSARLGTVDTPTLGQMYHTIDSHIDNIISKTPYLNEAKRTQLLNMKKTSDSLYSQHMKAINTKWVKALYSDTTTAKKALDNLITMGKENRAHYDDILQALSKENQVGLEQAMVKRLLDKAKVGEDGYALTKIGDDLQQLLPKINNPTVRDRAESIIAAGKIFQQDPVVSMIANNRMVMDKLAKAGLTYNPASSFLYSSWSRLYPRLQVAAVDMVERLPVARELIGLTPLYSSIKSSAKEINLSRSAESAFLRGNQGHFKDFLDRVLASDKLTFTERKSVEEVAKMYTKLADSFQGNQQEVKDFMAIVDKMPQYAGPIPEQANETIVEAVRNVAIERQATQAEAFLNKVRQNPNYAGPTPSFVDESIVKQLRQQGHIREARQVEEAAREMALRETETRQAVVSVTNPNTAKSLEGKVTEARQALDVDKEVTENIVKPTSNPLMQGKPYTPVEVPPNGFSFDEWEGLATRFKEVGDNLPGFVINNYTYSLKVGLQLPDGSTSPKVGVTFSKDGFVEVSSEDLKKLSGQGSTIYSGIYDIVEALGLKTKPTEGMNKLNEFRTSARFLQYMAGRTSDAPHLVYSDNMAGVPPRLAGQSVTKENIKQFNVGFRDFMRKNVFPKGMSVTTKTSNVGLTRLAKQATEEYPYSEKTLRIMRDLLRGNDGVVTGALLTTLFAQEDFINYLDKQ